MSISNYLELELLDQVFRNTAAPAITTPWISLHTGDPGETGASEATGGSYVRQSASFDLAAAGATANTGAVTFTSMPSGTLTHVGVWDASSAGNFLWGGSLTASKTLNTGDTFQINAGDLDVTLD
jgi:hypothetical protein